MPIRFGNALPSYGTVFDYAAKAEQIRVSGVTHVATSCLSCHRQLGELSKYYQLGVQVHTVAALAAQGFIMNKI